MSRVQHLDRVLRLSQHIQNPRAYRAIGRDGEKIMRILGSNDRDGINRVSMARGREGGFEHRKLFALSNVPYQNLTWIRPADDQVGMEGWKGDREYIGLWTCGWSAQDNEYQSLLIYYPLSWSDVQLHPGIPVNERYIQADQEDEDSIYKLIHLAQRFHWDSCCKKPDWVRDSMIEKDQHWLSARLAGKWQREVMTKE